VGREEEEGEEQEEEGKQEEAREEKEGNMFKMVKITTSRILEERSK